MPVLTIARSFEWLVAQITAGTLPDILYDWTALNVAEQQEATGKLVIVLWTDPETGQRYRVIDEAMPSAVLTAFRAQWLEATGE